MSQLQVRGADVQAGWGGGGDGTHCQAGLRLRHATPGCGGNTTASPCKQLTTHQLNQPTPNPPTHQPPLPTNRPNQHATALSLSVPRVRFLNRLVAASRSMLDPGARPRLAQHENFHGLCRLLGRLKTNYQLSELVGRGREGGVRMCGFDTPRGDFHGLCRLLGRLKTNYQLSELVGRGWGNGEEGCQDVWVRHATWGLPWTSLPSVSKPRSLPQTDVASQAPLPMLWIQPGFSLLHPPWIRLCRPQVAVDGYTDWIQAVAQLTVYALQQWEWAGSASYYLLGEEWGWRGWRGGGGGEAGERLREMGAARACHVGGQRLLLLAG